MKTLILIFVLYFFLFFQTWGGAFLAWGEMVPDLYYLVVIFLGLLLPSRQALLWGWLGGILRDGAACLPLGTYGSSYLLMILMVVSLKKAIPTERGLYLYAFLGCFFSNLLVLALSLLLLKSPALWLKIFYLSLYTLLFAPAVFFLLSPLRKISWEQEEGRGDDISQKLLFHLMIKEEREGEIQN